MLTLLAALSLAGWIYLVFFRGGFWRADQTLPSSAALDAWPDLVAVIPARNEAPSIGPAVESLLFQDYPGAISVIVADDASTDGTGESARIAAARLGSEGRLTVLEAPPLPEGWSGKLWALHNGLLAVPAGHRYVLLTDADIVHATDAMRRLVSRAECGGLDLVSLMVRLHCGSLAERLLIPAFVFFFQMLFPFAWVARMDRRTAAAAGGCSLVRCDALQCAGGIAAIRSEIIDDCALARCLKRQGPIWLGLTQRAASLRPYGSFPKIGRMISRSAYAQLGYSPVLLVGTVAGMVLVYLVPPLLAVLAEGPARWAGLGAWLMMALSFQPMLRFYRLSPIWGLALPAIGAAYTVFTVQSAFEVWRGRGGLWKGRVQAMTGGT